MVSSSLISFEDETFLKSKNRNSKGEENPDGKAADNNR